MVKDYAAGYESSLQIQGLYTIELDHPSTMEGKPDSWFVPCCPGDPVQAMSRDQQVVAWTKITLALLIDP